MANVNMNAPLPQHGGMRNDNIHDRYVHRSPLFFSKTPFGTLVTNQGDAPLLRAST
jgi:hypothetical protein